ncbi:MAG: hypothetical protein ACPLN2_08405 [Thermoproteota archaeon]
MGKTRKGMSQRAIEAILNTSALYPLLKKLGGDAASLLTKLTILDLTKCELGNTLWKEYKLGLLENWESTLENWSRIIEELPVYSINV